MRFSGLSPDGRLVEIVEIADHPFMLGTQFHPEFLSRPTRPHPLFLAFVRAACIKAGIPFKDPPEILEPQGRFREIVLYLQEII
jgi:CTP synthase